jgi:hypothetical protein
MDVLRDLSRLSGSSFTDDNDNLMLIHGGE